MFDGILNDPEFRDMVSGKLTQARLKELFRYDPKWGHFYNNFDRAHRSKEGDKAGWKSADGYIYLQIGEKRYAAHSLAWLWVYGELPDSKDVDHRNTKRDDNRITNLRKATRSQNKANSDSQIPGKSGVRGVYPHGNSWRAIIVANSTRINLGTFPNKCEAELRYLEARETFFGEFNHETFRNRLAEIAPMELEL